MTKQQEIREGLANKNREVLHTYSMVGLIRGKSPFNWDEAYLAEWGNVLADEILQYLHSQGCVLRVDRELPIKKHPYSRIFKDVAYEAQEVMLKAGYVAVEPLIKTSICSKK